LESWDIASLDVQPHHPQVLHSDTNTRAIAINLPAGELMQEHETHERAYLVVVAGRVDVDQGGEVADAGPGFLAHFEAAERREIRATEDALVILVLAPWPGEGHPSAAA
jgi:quercetin dioxygenase-like cupin family protein